ncbi:MAG: glutamate racemase [Spirochaetia bacterium]|nr:glutamate racemase [Spirochaetia bacterium]
MSDKRPIGVFDSGMGGLTVLSELQKKLPHENFIYVGDTARVPYGSRSERTVQRYSLEISEYLKKYDIKILVIACNTATAYAESLLKKSLEIPVIGVVDPGVDALLSRTGNHCVGVIGTRSTIKSQVYEKRIKKKNENITVFSKACPLFVPIVEEGWMEHEATKVIIADYLKPMAGEGIDSLVLGCTHYPLLKHAIQKSFPFIKLIDSSIETASSVSKILLEKNLERKSKTVGKIQILVTDLTDQMLGLEKLFLGFGGIKIKEVKIPEE